jgi:uncharacterized protein (TIGR00251 family)
MSPIPVPVADCLRPLADGCELWVQVVPNAARTACAGQHDGALRVRLAAPPLEGRANAALIKWLADSLRLPRRSVRLIAGDTARRKRLHIDAPAAEVAQWVRAQLADGADDAAR